MITSCPPALRITAAAIALSCVSFSASAASATLNGGIITKMSHEISTLRGPKGRAYISLDRSFPLPGGCLYGGAIDAPSGWILEFSVELGSFKSMWAMALTAYAAGRSVNLDYDDGFGAGTTCRITNLQIAD